MGILQFIHKVCEQTALYWEPNGHDGYQVTYIAPVEIKCRWDEVAKIIVGENGKEITSNATILLTQDVKVGGWLSLHKLADFPGGTDFSNPRNIDGAFEIAMKEKTPLFRSTNKFVHTAFLKSDATN